MAKKIRMFVDDVTGDVIVVGKLKAKEYVTGDITFTDKASGIPLWRMYEDPKGLYLQSSTTGKNYRIMLEEVKE